MLQRLLELSKQPLFRAGVLVLALAVFSGLGYGLYATQAAPPQPIQFPHSRHVALGVQCLYCHPGAWRQASAGLPTTQKCWGCHQQTPLTQTSPELQKLAAYAESGKSIPWVPVAMVPDFVHFNHRPHIAAGLNCENCHGEVGEMGIYQNPQVLNMGWCLTCHRERTQDDPEKRIKLLDCGTCHY